MMTNKKNEIKPWEEVSREVMFEKFGRGIEKVIFRQGDGEEYDVYIKKEAPVVAVLALTPDKQVIMVQQFRPGQKKIVLDLPGGILNTEDAPEEHIKKELLEETGYEGNLQFVSSAIECGYSTKIKYGFVATECKKVKNIFNNLHDDDGDAKGFKEEKRVILVSLDKFRKLLQQGQFADVQIGYMGLDYLGLL